MNKEIPEGSYLSKNGYVIKKSSISEDELLFLKTELLFSWEESIYSIIRNFRI